MVIHSKYLISVILATKNEEKNINRCLTSLRKQSFNKHLEIIVVDLNSTDETRKLAKKYTKHVYNLFKYRKLSGIKNFRGAQLNFGVEKSNGKIIFFPDTDMTFDKKLLEESTLSIKKGDIDALYIPEIIIGEGELGKIRNFERGFYNMTSIDAVRLVKKNIYNRVDGFDEKIQFGPDDWDFTKKIKKISKKISITKNKLYHHEESIDLRQYLGKKMNYSFTFNEYIKKWGKDDTDVKKQLGFYYRYLIVFIENGKWKRLIFYPILTIEMFFLRFLIGINYFIRRFLNENKT